MVVVLVLLVLLLPILCFVKMKKPCGVVLGLIIVVRLPNLVFLVVSMLILKFAFLIFRRRLFLLLRFLILPFLLLLLFLLLFNRRL